MLEYTNIIISYTTQNTPMPKGQFYNLIKSNEKLRQEKRIFKQFIIQNNLTKQYLEYRQKLILQQRQQTARELYGNLQTDKKAFEEEDYG